VSGCASAGSSNSKSSGDMADALERAVDQAFKDIGRSSRIAVIHIQTNNTSTTNFLIGELQHILVSRRYNVVDRVDLDAIRTERNFQYSYEVDDNTAVSLGKFVGADLVVTGGIDGEGSYRRLRLKVLETETTIIRGTGSVPYSEVEQQYEYRQRTPYTPSYGTTYPPYEPPPPTPKKTSSRTSSGVSFKLYGGIGLNTVENGSDDPFVKEMNGTIGYHGGLSFDIYLWQSVLMIEPGVRYVHKEYEYTDVYSNNDIVGQINYIDIYGKGKIELPLGKNVSIQPFMGYGAAILLNCFEQMDGSDQYDCVGKTNSLVFEIPMGADIVIGDAFVIGAEFVRSLSNVWKKDYPEWKSNTYMVTVGLKF